MRFSESVTSSVLARALALFILSAVMICAIAIATADYLTSRPIPELVTTVLGIGIGYAGTLIGVNFGVVLQPAPAQTIEEKKP